MATPVADSGAMSEAFSVTDGVKRSCVLTHTLLSLMFTVVLINACLDECPGISVAQRTDGQLVNQQQMHLQSDASITAVQELVFAYACVLNVATEGEMQKRMDLFAVAHNNFGLVINTEKTGVMHQPPSEAASSAL
nr:unnamed protein product [Spirometra erinaceieuropaei]